MNKREFILWSLLFFGILAIYKIADGMGENLFLAGQLMLLVVVIGIIGTISMLVMAYKNRQNFQPLPPETVKGGNSKLQVCGTIVTIAIIIFLLLLCLKVLFVDLY